MIIMSAITGILHRDGRPVKHDQIKKMNDLLSHRGPDGSKIWCEGSVAMGHQMLCTTPESLHEILPFEEDDLVITADARIDNRTELSKKLDIINKEEISDSYFILKAYQKWGENCSKELLGDFALVIWDKNNEKLFCARDHMGVKPFYYYLSDNAFFFATELKSILCNAEVGNKLNELKVAHHLIPIITDKELTFYEDIHRLPAAHNLTIKKNNFRKIKYWELDPDLKILLDSEEEYYEKFRQIFAEAIRCRIRSNHKLGFELSGGIDSSSVVGMAKKVLKAKNMDIDTFSLIFDEIKEADESFYINKVVETGGIRPHFLVADSIDPFKEIEKILWYLDEPLTTPNMSLIWQLYKKMNEEGIRVVLDGHDGDSVFYKGENYFRELFVNFNWIKLNREIIGYSNRIESDRFKVFISQVLFPLIPKTSEIWMKYKKVRKEKDFAIINEKFDLQLNLKKHYNEVELSHYKRADNSKKSHYFYLTLGTHQYIFEFMDKFAGAFCIEPRHPIMDKRLIEFCYSVPTEIKFKNGWGRMLARNGLADVLPKEVQKRGMKVNFGHVIERNLLLFEKEYLNHLIYENEPIKKYIDFDEVSNIYRRYFRRKQWCWVSLRHMENCYTQYMVE